MANVIDSLFITLGIDVSQFEKGKDKALDGLNKVDQAADKTNKNNQKRDKERSESIKKAEQEESRLSKNRIDRNNKDSNSFDEVAAALGKMGASLVTVGAVTQAFMGSFEKNVSIGRTSQLLGENAKDLDAWGNAIKRVGGDSSQFIGSIQNIQSELAKFHLGQGGQQTVQALAQLGVATNGKGSEFLLSISDQLKKVRDNFGELEAKSFAERLGLNDDAYFFLTKSREEIEKIVAEGKKQSGVTDEATESAKRLNDEFGKLKGNITGAADEMFVKIAPAIEYLIKLFDIFISKQRDSKITGLTIPGTLMNLGKSVYESLKSTPGDKQTASGKIKGLGGDESGAGGKVQASEIVDFFKKKGWTEDQSKGIAANILKESSGNPSAVGDQGRAVGLGQWHPDRQATFKKLYNKDIRESTAQEQMSFFDWELRNTHKKAGDMLKQQTNAGEAAKVVSLYHEIPAAGYMEANQRAMLANNLPLAAYQPQQAQSSNQPTSQTNIENLNVYTQAKDGDSVVSSIQKTLAKNQVMNAGIGGAR